MKNSFIKQAVSSSITVLMTSVTNTMEEEAPPPPPPPPAMAETAPNAEEMNDMSQQSSTQHSQPAMEAVGKRQRKVTDKMKELDEKKTVSRRSFGSNSNVTTTTTVLNSNVLALPVGVQNESKPSIPLPTTTAATITITTAHAGESGEEKKRKKRKLVEAGKPSDSEKSSEEAVHIMTIAAATNAQAMLSAAGEERAATAAAATTTTGAAVEKEEKQGEEIGSQSSTQGDNPASQVTVRTVSSSSGNNNHSSTQRSDATVVAPPAPTEAKKRKPRIPKPKPAATTTSSTPRAIRPPEGYYIPAGGEVVYKDDLYSSDMREIGKMPMHELGLLAKALHEASGEKVDYAELAAKCEVYGASKVKAICCVIGGSLTEDGSVYKLLLARLTEDEKIVFSALKNCFLGEQWWKNDPRISFINSLLHIHIAPDTQVVNQGENYMQDAFTLWVASQTLNQSVEVKELEQVWKVLPASVQQHYVGLIKKFIEIKTAM